ncbi:MAG: YeeE/YedE family protein, partial [Burkholderiales bacterium]
MGEVDVAALQTTVAWLAFAIAVVVGAVMNRTNYCSMGALSDIVNMGDWDRMRMWVLAIGVAMIGTGLLAGAGLIDPGKTIYTGSNLLWLSSLVGGLLFGIGMVLASGCGSKTLVR